MNRFQTPHTSGGFLEGHVKVASSGGVDVYVAQDIKSTAPTFAGTTIDRLASGNSTGGTDFALGLLSFVDVISMYGGEGLKIQLFGFNKNSWQMSIQGAQATSNTTNSATTSSGTYTAWTNLTARDYGISFGKEFGEGTTWYMSFAYRDLTGVSSINQPGLTTILNDTGVQRIYAIGLDQQWQWFTLGIEYSRGSTSWTRASDFWIDGWGFDAGARW